MPRLIAMFEFLMVLALVYLVANIIRYFFFSQSSGDARGFFGLSDIWIRNTKKGK